MLRVAFAAFREDQLQPPAPARQLDVCDPTGGARTFVTTAFEQIVVSEPSSSAGGNGFAEGTELWIGWSPADATLVAS